MFFSISGDFYNCVYMCHCGHLFPSPFGGVLYRQPDLLPVIGSTTVSPVMLRSDFVKQTCLVITDQFHQHYGVVTSIIIMASMIDSFDLWKAFSSFWNHLAE